LTQKEQTLLFVKPDGVMRGLTGEIIRRIERKGLLITAIKLLKLNRETGPILAMVIEGPNAVSVVRKLIGKTSPFEAEPGTIRGDFGINLTKNVVHASDNVENAEKEVAFFFKKREILRYEKPTEKKFAL